jgi:signal transduction histidine kinase
MDYSLSPAALGPTVIIFVYGIHRYHLLDAQPILRSDVIEHLGEGVVLADAGGTTLDANHAAELALGVDRESLKGLHLVEVLELLNSEDDALELRDRLAAMPLDGGYEPAGRFLSLRDRSKQRRSERLLRERQKLESVGTLAAGVAHEVNNPLAYVRSNLKQMQELVELAMNASTVDDDQRPWDEIPEILAESVEGLDRIGRIVETMLRFSRVPEERMGPVDLNETLEVALRLAELHRNRGVEVSLELAPGLSPVRGSPERLVQVVLNLLLNGKQALAGQPDARIFVEIEQDGEWAVVRIHDNGPGIPEQNRQRIFDPFFTTRAPDEGTGLGLAIAFDIVREHGGTLELDSKEEKGTSFTIRLPTIND